MSLTDFKGVVSNNALCVKQNAFISFKVSNYQKPEALRVKRYMLRNCDISCQTGKKYTWIAY